MVDLGVRPAFESLFRLALLFQCPVRGFPLHEMHEGLSPHLAGMWIAFVVAAVLIAFFTRKVSGALRRREMQRERMNGAQPPC